MQKLLIILGIVILSGCVISKQEYPSEWANLSTDKIISEDLIVGEYDCTGKYDSGKSSISLIEILNLQNTAEKNCTRAKIIKYDAGVLEVSFYDKQSICIYKTNLHKGKDFYIKNNWIILTGIGEGGINREGVVGFSIEKTLISVNAEHDLVVKRTETAVAIVLLFPVAASGNNWVKFSSINNP